MENYKYIFGPVPSRRLGRSLGVDLVPLKTCSFDCIFCQLGRTPEPTMQRMEYVPTESVIQELEQWLETSNQADFITLSGSGEPTLHSKFGEIMQFVKDHSEIPTAILTNGSLLSMPEIREQAQLANMLKVSLSAWDQASLEKINRPHSEVSFNDIIKGLRQFSTEYKGSLMIEVFLIQGINDHQEGVSKIAEYINELDVEKVQFNTIIRPPAEKGLQAVPAEKLQELSQDFNPDVEIVTDYKANPDKRITSSVNSVLALLKRRPCTIEELIEVSGRSSIEVEDSIRELLQRNAIKMFRQDGKEYYLAQ